MAASGPAAVAALTASTAGAAVSGPSRLLPYVAARRHAPPLVHQPTAAAAAAGPTTTGHAPPVTAVFRRSIMVSGKGRAVTHGSSAGASRLPPQAGVPAGTTRRSHAVLVRYFREGNSLGGPGGDVPPPPPPPPPPPSPNTGPSSGGARADEGGGDAAAAERPPSPQGNAVPFVASTRQRHHQAAAAAAAAAMTQREVLAARRCASAGSEEDEAYAGADEEIRQRSQALREAMFLEAKRRAVGLHPDVLVGELGHEATVPYDLAGALEPPPASYGEAGEAGGPPSGGGGPLGGLQVEDVDVRTGGFTTSRPDVDPAYDDVGRAIRGEQGSSRRQHHHQRPSLLAAEARARKAATAEDLREGLLDAAPELQDTYRVFGLPAGAELLRRARGGGGGGGGGEMEASDEEVEALLESAAFGAEGAVLAEAAEEPPEAASVLPDPLAATTGGAAGMGANPLDAALDALEHREVLDLLQSGAAGPASTASTDEYADVSNVMPSPLLGTPPATATATGSAAASGRSSSNSGGRARSAQRLAAAATSPPARRGVVIRSGVRRAGPHPAPPAPSSGYPPFYHTSPDVPEEDLTLHRRLRWRPARRLVPSASTAAAAARFARGAARKTPRVGDAAPVAAPVEAPANASAGGGSMPTSGAGWVRQAQLYNTSPDVPDEELERGARGASASTSQTPPERPPAGTGPRRNAPSAAPSNTAAACPPPPQPVTAASAPPPSPSASPRADGDGRRLRSLGDVDRQFIDLDSVGGRSATQRMTTPPPGARGASSSLQPQTIGIHGIAGAAGYAAAGAGSGHAAAASGGSGGGGGSAGAAAGGDGRSVTVLRVECVPSQTYGVARTAAVLAADGQLTLLARPTGPSPERVRAALKLLRMAPDSHDFRTSAAEAAATAADNDERAAAATEAAAVAAAAAMAAAVGSPAMELEAQTRPAPPLVHSAAVEERDLQPGLILGQSEIDPAEVMADPTFPLDSNWTDHHDPHDPHATPPMAEGEGHMLGLQANMWHEDYDEVMGQIYDGQRSGWSEDAVNGGFDSDVY